MSITLFSPAKINLNFKLIGKREDGYHLIESDMVAINLFDTLTIEPHSSNTLEGTKPLPFDFERSIFQKGHLLLKRRFKNLPFVKITLNKNIPIGAGLGGGSSNLATFLWGMNELFHLNMHIHELAKFGAMIGADVPFFFSHGSAFVHGIGTNVDNTNPLQSTLFTLFFYRSNGINANGLWCSGYARDRCRGKKSTREIRHEGLSLLSKKNGSGKRSIPKKLYEWIGFYHRSRGTSSPTVRTWSLFSC